MTRHLLNQWLEAERQPEHDEAEIALFELFAQLPMPTPSAGFADQVLLQAGIIRPADLQGAWRHLTMIALTFTSLVVACSAPWVSNLLAQLDIASVIGLLTRTMTAAIHLLVDFWSVGTALGSFCRAIWLAAASPQSLAVLCMVTAFIFIVSRWLVALISSQRSSTYVSI